VRPSQRRSMASVRISVEPEREVYAPGEEVLATFEYEGLSRVVEVEYGYACVERSLLAVGSHGGTVSDGASVVLVEDARRVRTDASAFSDTVRVALPEGLPSYEVDEPSVEYSRRHELFMRVRRRLAPDYEASRVLLVAEPQPAPRGRAVRAELRLGPTALELYCDSDVAAPGGELAVGLRNLGDERVRVRAYLRTYAWVFGEAVAGKATLTKVLLLDSVLEPRALTMTVARVRVPERTPPDLTAKLARVWTVVEVVRVLGPLALREERLGEVRVTVPYTGAYVDWLRELARGRRPPTARICPSCMRDVPEYADRCPHCGFELAARSR